MRHRSSRNHFAQADFLAMFSHQAPDRRVTIGAVMMRSEEQIGAVVPTAAPDSDEAMSRQWKPFHPPQM
jgi:hypothetical protein